MARFAQLVQRVLNRARARGLTDRDITEATGISGTTFHRWRRGEWGRDWPQLQKVIDFFEGLGEDPEEAFATLGVINRRMSTSPDPIEQDPRLAVIYRRLADPNVTRDEKILIKAMLDHLVELAERAGRRTPTET